MLRRGSLTRLAPSLHLYFRVHVLRRVRRVKAPLHVSKLRRRARAAASAPGCETSQVPRLHPARVQTIGLQICLSTSCLSCPLQQQWPAALAITDSPIPSAISRATLLGRRPFLSRSLVDLAAVGDVVQWFCIEVATSLCQPQRCKMQVPLGGPDEVSTDFGWRMQRVL
jgi:hypothetical protein